MPIETITSVSIKRKAGYPVPDSLAPGELGAIEDNGNGHAELYMGDSTGVPLLLASGPGATGLAGIQGQTGVQGVQGQTGIAGIQGQTGLAGITGLRGSTGIAGIQGSTGLGTQGQTGVQGQTGLAGITGLQGRTGIAGIQGQTGVQGVQGQTGIAGIQGQTGIAGIQGQTGVQGIQGQTGLAGITGLRGSTGIAGIQGATGPMPPVSGSTNQGIYYGPSGVLTGSQVLTYGSTTIGFNAPFTSKNTFIKATDLVGNDVWGSYAPCNSLYGGKLVALEAGGRLSASSTDARAWSTSTSTPWTIYYTPDIHQWLGLWDSSYSRWVRCQLPVSPMSISSSSLTSSVPNDIFAYIYGWDSSGPVLALQPYAWSSTTARNSSYDVVQADGVWTRTSGKSYRYLGTVFPNSTDTLASRTIWNVENQIERPIEYSTGGSSTADWTVTAATRQTRHYGATAPQKAVEFCTGLPNTPCFIVAEANIQAISGGVAYLGVGLDAASSNPVPFNTAKWAYQNNSSILQYMVTGPAYISTPGYHWFSIIEGVIGTGTQKPWLPAFLTGWIKG